MKKRFCFFSFLLVSILGIFSICFANNKKIESKESNQKKEGIVSVIDMKMMLLPGTSSYFHKSLIKAKEDNAKVIIVSLDTPGGLLKSSQDIIQDIFASDIPVVVYVSPQGATATSAGVFVTLASHVAVMADGTSIGSAHPVDSEGKDIQGDMRKKAKNMAIAMIKSIAKKRNRNIDWAQKSVKDSVSITAMEAQEKNVIDFTANSITELLQKLQGRKIKLKDNDFVFDDYSKLKIKNYEMSFQDKLLNILSNPSIAVLLWLGATTGIIMELYHPGAIFPGIFGTICLVLALIVNEVVPVSIGGLILIIAGLIMIGMELYITSGILGLGGVVAIIIGSMTLIDLSDFPEVSLNPWIILPSAIFLCISFLLIMFFVFKVIKRKEKTGIQSIVGEVAIVQDDFKDGEGNVFVDGALWNAVLVDGTGVKKDEKVKVVSFKKGHLVLEVIKSNKEEK